MATIISFLVDFSRSYGTDILSILLLYFFGKIILAFIVKRTIKLADDGDDTNDSRAEKRAKTLGNVVMSIGNIIIYIVILLMMLSLFGVDIRPILAGVGIGGLAIGFGAQSLVKDFVTGLFILIEGQYDVGDMVKVGSFEGEVIKLTMRSTVLRDMEGKTYFISNGSVSNVINVSRHAKDNESQRND